MGERTEYIRPLDRHDNFLFSIDGSKIYIHSTVVEVNDFVEVIKIKGQLGHQFQPCNKCIYKNIVHNNVLMGNNTHAVYIRAKSFNQNQRSGQGQPYTEFIGTCKNFTQVDDLRKVAHQKEQANIPGRF